MCQPRHCTTTPGFLFSVILYRRTFEEDSHSRVTDVVLPNTVHKREWIVWQPCPLPPWCFGLIYVFNWLNPLPQMDETNTLENEEKVPTEYPKLSLRRVWDVLDCLEIRERPSYPFRTPALLAYKPCSLSSLFCFWRRSTRGAANDT